MLCARHPLRILTGRLSSYTRSVLHWNPVSPPGQLVSFFRCHTTSFDSIAESTPQTFSLPILTFILFGVYREKSARLLTAGFDQIANGIELGTCTASFKSPSVCTSIAIKAGEDSFVCPFLSPDIKVLLGTNVSTLNSGPNRVDKCALLLAIFVQHQLNASQHGLDLGGEEKSGHSLEGAPSPIEGSTTSESVTVSEEYGPNAVKEDGLEEAGGRLEAWDFEEVGTAGEGMFSSVFAARAPWKHIDTRFGLGHLVAIKEINTSRTDEDIARNEIKARARVSGNPYVSSSYTKSEEARTVFLVTELLSGPTLEAWLAEEGFFSE